MSNIEIRSPAPRCNDGNRAEVKRDATSFSIIAPEPEANLPALYIARRFGLSGPLARVVVALAGLGRAFA